MFVPNARVSFLPWLNDHYLIDTSLFESLSYPDGTLGPEEDIKKCETLCQETSGMIGWLTFMHVKQRLLDILSIRKYNSVITVLSGVHAGR